MAEIDKILPNVSQDVKLPSASKVALEQQQQMAEQMKQPSELQPNEDGSVDVNFGPENLQVGPDQGHFSNLAELLPDDVLDPLGSELYNNYTDITILFKFLYITFSRSMYRKFFEPEIHLF